MHLLLTDRLTCPRCGPSFGLILLADRMADRRVHEGTLGCPNCRDSYSVSDGFTDLRAPPRGPLAGGRAGADPRRVPQGSGARGTTGTGQADGSSPSSAAADRIVALLGIHRGPGTVVLAGRAARFAHALAAAVEDLQAVAMDPDTRRWSEAASVSRMVSAPGLPFFSRMLRGAVVDGGLGRALVFEAARVVAPKSRVVVVDAPDDTSSVLEEAGLHVLAAESGTVVATRG